jgi:hypothetical protein
MGDKELRRFVRITLGLLSELECELLVARSLQLLSSDVVSESISRIGRIHGMLQRLHWSLGERRGSRSRVDGLESGDDALDPRL